MANGNFIVQNGLQVGNLIITDTGDITTTGNVTVIGGGSINVDAIGVSSIAKNDSSISINDTGIASAIVIAVDGATIQTIDAGGTNIAAGRFAIAGSSVLDSTTLGSGVHASSLTSVGTLGTLAVTGNVSAGGFAGPSFGTHTGPVIGNVTGNTSGTALTVTQAAQPTITSVGTLTSLAVSGTATAGTFSGPLSGNASTATVLQTARNINGVSFNGSADITIASNASTVTGTTLATSVVTSSLTTVGNLTQLAVGGNVTVAGEMVMTGNILPSTTLTYDLGSPAKQWHSVYVGPGSLYVNNQKVLQDESGTIVMSADLDQNISIQTKGAGDVIIDPTGTGVISLRAPVQVQAGNSVASSDGNAVQFSTPIAVNVLSSRDTNTDLTITANGTGTVKVDDNMLITGNLNVTGTTTNLSVTTLTINDNIVDIAAGQVGTPSVNAGIRVVRGDGAATQLRWTESASQWQFTNDGATYNPMLIAGALASSLVPTADATYDLGSPSMKWRNIYAGASGVSAGNITVAGDTISSTFNTITIDPATAGSGGTVIIAGNLQVTGTTTTIDSTTVTTNDLNIVVANNAGTAGAANGAGLTVGGPAAASIAYASGTDSWDFNKNVTATLRTAAQPNVTSLGTLTSLAVTGAASAGSFTGPLTGTVTGSLIGNASTATTLATARAINGVNFDGSAAITVTANASTLTSATLNSSVINSSLTSVGTLGSLAVTGAVTAGSFAGPLTGAVTGNASTATALATPRAINGVNFDGTSAITVTAAAGTLTGSTLAAGVTSSSLTSVGTLVSLGVTGAVTAGSFSGPLTGAVTGTVSGNAGSATVLQTARLINGVSFNGSADVTVTAAAGTLSGATLASGVTASSLTSVGTLGVLAVTGNVTAGGFAGPTFGTHTGAVVGAVNGTIGATTPTSANFTTITTSGDILVGGNLTVSGASTIINATTLDVVDLNVTIAKNAATQAAADGAGLTVNGANATITYVNATNSWDFNKNVTATLRTAAQPNITSVGTLTSLGVTGTVTAGAFSGPITGAVTGNASTATTLQTARAINGVNFDGSSAITITANASTLSGTSLAATVTASSLTSVGTLGALTVSGTTTSGAFSGPLTGAVTGNASTATTLQTARNINGVSFNGSADITVTAAAGTLTGTSLPVSVTGSSLTSVGTLGSLAVTAGVTAGSFTGPLTGAVTGNATTATTLQTARAINGVSFNGSADITVTAAAGTLTGATLAAGVTASSLTSVGTLTGVTTSGIISVNNVGFIDSNTLVTSATTASQVVDQNAIATYRVVKYQISITSGGSFQYTEVTLMHDGTNVYMDETDVLNTGAILATFTADVFGGNMRLLTTPTNAITTYKLMTTHIAV
jgi:hypothetical protein